METYVIKGERGSGTICLNGPAARKVAVGDVVVAASQHKKIDIIEYVFNSVFRELDKR